MAVMLFVGSAAASFLIIGRHFGAAYSNYIWHGPGLSQLGWYTLVAALAASGYGAVFLMCGLLFRNPMIPAAVVFVWENLNPFLPSLLKKISVIFYLRQPVPGGSPGAAAAQPDRGGNRPHPRLVSHPRPARRVAAAADLHCLLSEARRD
jgi:hypothetical protein